MKIEILHPTKIKVGVGGLEQIVLSELKTLKEKAANRGLRLEDDLVESAITGFPEGKIYSSGNDLLKNCLKIITSEGDENILKGVDQSARKIAGSKAKTDVVISGKKISLKYSTSQLTSLEPQGLYDIFIKIFNNPKVANEISSIDSEEEKEKINKLHDSMFLLKDLVHRYRLEGKELEDAIIEKYTKKWEKKKIESDLKKIGKAGMLDISKEEFLSSMSDYINLKASQVKNPKTIVALDPNQKFDQATSQEIIDLVAIHRKKRKEIRSMEDYKNDSKNIDEAIRLLWEHVPAFKKQILYDFVTGAYTKEGDLVADYLLFIRSDKDILFEKIDSPDKALEVLENLGISIRSALKGRGNMFSSANVRIDIGTKKIEK